MLMTFHSISQEWLTGRKFRQTLGFTFARFAKSVSKNGWRSIPYENQHRGKLRDASNIKTDCKRGHPEGLSEYAVPVAARLTAEPAAWELNCQMNEKNLPHEVSELTVKYSGVKMFVMTKCPHCGAINSPGYRVCPSCSLDLEISQAPIAPSSEQAISTRILVILILVSAAILLILWLVLCAASSGLSDT